MFIPGLLCTERLFSAQTDAIGRSRPVSVADHRGHDTIAAIAASVLAAAPPRFALCGLSMGGYLALEMLRVAPERIDRVALLDTAATPDTPAQRERRLRLIGEAEAGRFDPVPLELWPLFVHPDRRDDAPLLGAFLAMATETGAAAFVRQQRAILARPDSRPSLTAIGCPTLVLVGAQDAATPPSEARIMADAIPGAVLKIVPECGHLSTMERPDAVTAALERWLRD